MTVRVHIERVIVDGVPAGRERAVAAALERELARALAGRRLGPAARAGRMRTPPVALPPGGDAPAAGARIGRALGEGLTR
jgi:hypothetical protein